MSTYPEIPGYRIEENLGQGRLTDVFLAVQEETGAKHVIKVLRDELTRESRFGERFLYEARRAARLDHPNIARILDVGNTSTHFFYIREYFPESLRNRVDTMTSQAGPPLDLDSPGAGPSAGLNNEELYDILDMCRQLFDALDYVAQEEIVHRDLRTDNIFFREDGTPVITDFYLGDLIRSSNTLREQNIRVIPPHYISPEQVLKRSIRTTADIYSLGVSLYELLTGNRPYEGAEAIDIENKHIMDPPPLLPPKLINFQPLIERMMTKSVDERAQSWAELILILEELTEDLGEPDDVPAPPPAGVPMDTVAAAPVEPPAAPSLDFGGIDTDMNAETDPGTSPPAVVEPGPGESTTLSFGDSDAAVSSEPPPPEPPPQDGPELSFGDIEAAVATEPPPPPPPEPGAGIGAELSFGDIEAAVSSAPPAPVETGVPGELDFGEIETISPPPAQPEEMPVENGGRHAYGEVTPVPTPESPVETDEGLQATGLNFDKIDAAAEPPAGPPMDFDVPPVQPEPTAPAETGADAYPGADAGSSTFEDMVTDVEREEPESHEMKQRRSLTLEAADSNFKEDLLDRFKDPKVLIAGGGLAVIIIAIVVFIFILGGDDSAIVEPAPMTEAAQKELTPEEREQNHIKHLRKIKRVTKYYKEGKYDNAMALLVEAEQYEVSKESKEFRKKIEVKQKEMADHNAFKAAADLDTPDGLREYLGQYPKGLHAVEAQEQIKTLLEAARKRAELEERLASLRVDLRSTYAVMPKEKVKVMVKERGFYEKYYNSEGNFLNAFELRTGKDGSKLVYDQITRLMWPQGGSTQYMDFEDAAIWLETINASNYGGYSDWRLPTMEEALSLLENKENRRGLFLDEIFTQGQKYIWTGDKADEIKIWALDFFGGDLNSVRAEAEAFIRPVRKGT